MTPDQPVEEHFGGLYRGVVLSNRDPQRRRRLLVKVPALNGDAEVGWAQPCVPPGLYVATIENGRPVWVMFEHGSIDHPVWVGTWMAPVDADDGGQAQ